MTQATVPVHMLVNDARVGELMRVLQINSVCGSGSTGRIAEGIHRLANARGDTSCIAFGRGSAPDGIDAIRIGSGGSVGLHVALSRLSDRQGFYSTTATRRLLVEIDRYRPDVVHLHNIHGYYLDVSLLFPHLAAMRVPVVWTLHDCWPLTGHCAHFDYVGCNRWITGCFDCPQKSSYPRSLIMDRARANWHDKRDFFTMPACMEIVVPSDWMKSLVSESYLRDYRTRVIRNGVNTAVFRPTRSDFRQRHGLQGRVIILGVAAKWSQRKGLDDFVSLARLIESPGTGLKQFSVVLVGLTASQRREMPASIVALGPTRNALELAEAYSAADVLFNPTHEDNYPTVNLEALACGTPVVTYNTGGSPESVRQGVDGHVLQEKSAEVFAGFLVTQGLDSLRVDCRSDLSEEARLASYLALYDRITAADGPTG